MRTRVAVVASLRVARPSGRAPSVLSRIARSLYAMGREVERALNVVRILEVTHKTNLQRHTLEEPSAWIPLAEAFRVALDEPGEAGLYAVLVEGREHPFSAARCIASARERGRSLRHHISEELWAHLNRYVLHAGPASFAAVQRRGRSEFNLEVEAFCDAFHGVADDTMLHGSEWRFLRMGRFAERAEMIGRILEIKRRRLLLAPGEEGRPIDFHHWQGMLRSLSAWEAYRRCHDARLVPERALDFVLRSRDFPRSLLFCLGELAALAEREGPPGPRRALAHVLEAFAAELRGTDARAVLARGDFAAHVAGLRSRAGAVSEALEAAFFRGFHRVPAVAHHGDVAPPQVSQ